MSKKLLKVFLILLVIFSIGTICSYATDINLNLPGTDNNQGNNNTNNQTTNNNQVADNTTTNTNNLTDNNDTTLSDNPLDDMQTLQPTVSESSSSGLSVTNIINILLIAVGVILILLAIAIMIRLK